MLFSISSVPLKGQKAQLFEVGQPMLYLAVVSDGMASMVTELPPPPPGVRLHPLH